MSGDHVTIRLSENTLAAVHRVAEATIAAHGLTDALADGQVDMGEVALPLDTFKRLAQGGTTITRDGLVNATLVQLFADGLTEQAKQTTIAEGGDVTRFTAAADARFDGAPGGDMRIAQVTLTEEVTQGGETAVDTFDDASSDEIAELVFATINAYDVDWDGKIQVFSELGSPERGFQIEDLTIHNPASPLKTTRDIAALAGAKGEISFSDVVNLIIAHQADRVSGAAVQGAARP